MLAVLASVVFTPPAAALQVRVVPAAPAEPPEPPAVAEIKDELPPAGDLVAEIEQFLRQQHRPKDP